MPGDSRPALGLRPCLLGHRLRGDFNAPGADHLETVRSGPGKQLPRPFQGMARVATTCRGER